jgi:hypothetical protein
MLEFFSIKQNNKIYTLAELHKLGLLEYSSTDSAAQIRINFPEDLDTQEEILLVNEARHQVDSAVFYLDEEYIAENIECTNGNLLYIRSPVPISSYTKALFEEYKLTLKF